MSEQNKELSRRLIEDVFSGGRLETADEILAPEAIGHDPALPEPTRGPEGLKAAATGYRTGFPDLTIKVEEQLAEGDSVCTRWTAVGTNTVNSSLGCCVPLGTSRLSNQAKSFAGSSVLGTS